MTDDEFLNAVRGIRESAFRFEAQPLYTLTYERADFEAWLAGDRTPPTEIAWWRPWLDRVAGWKRQGITVSRVRVHEEPPTRYQEWMIWSTPWAARAGERIGYLPRTLAEDMNLPSHDWWLLDAELPDAKVIIMQFTGQGEPTSKILLTGPEVDGYRELRDAAIGAAESLAA